MRTFWLKGEDKSRELEAKAKSKFDERSKTPDLLCIDEIRMNNGNGFFKNHSTRSLNNINSSLLFSALTNHKNPEPLTSLQTSKNFPSHDCYLCQKKKYLFQKYHAELRHKCEKFEGLLNYTSSTSFSPEGSPNGCACHKQTLTNTVPSRSPNSAPHIIFKE